MLIGAIAALISVGRLWLFDRSAPSEVLWAEDGLFTLCIHKADFWTCLTDPFAGYLLLAPRVLVWPVSLLPWETWALAANLVAALLAGVIAAEGDSGQHEGAYFGWWNFATKLNLALAAGLALPLLGWWGYTPGTRSDDGLHTLGLAYAVLPCALKLLAAAALYWLVLRPARGAASA